MRRTIQDLIAAKTGKIVQECKILCISLLREGYSMEDYISYIDTIKPHTLPTRVRHKKVKVKYPCPKCGNPMDLFPVNTTPRTQVGENFKSHWQCPRCLHDKFTEKEPALEWAEAEQASK